MATFIETGHAKNVANFEQLTLFVAGFGKTYNPAKTSLKLTAMQTMLTNAKAAVTAVNAAIPANKNAISARDAAFEPLSKLVTRVANSVSASDASDQAKENVKTLARKIQGKRAQDKKTDEELQALAAQGKETRNVSSSQMSFDSRLDSFDKLIKQLASIPEYAPNELDLKVAALTTLYTTLQAKNSVVVSSQVPLSAARIARNELLYKPKIGLVDTAIDCKTYVKSVFGPSSSQYKQLSKLQFTDMNK